MSEPTKPPVVLVADDDAGVRWLLATYLGQQGFDVRLASHGDEALSLLRSSPDEFQVAVLDVDMPGLSGPEVLTAIRLIRPGFPAVLLVSEADGDGFHDEAGTEVVRKPIPSLDELAARLRRLATG